MSKITMQGDNSPGGVILHWERKTKRDCGREIQRCWQKITDLRQQLEAERARVAELWDALALLREPWDLDQILGAETRRRVEYADKVLNGGNAKARDLRLQAEAVDECISDIRDLPEYLALSDSEINGLKCAIQHCIGEAQHLRQRADELESDNES